MPLWFVVNNLGNNCLRYENNLYYRTALNYWKCKKCNVTIRTTGETEHDEIDVFPKKEHKHWPMTLNEIACQDDLKHWLTLFIDIEQRSFTLIDSLGTTKDQFYTAFANWLLYVENDPALRAIHAARPFQLVEVSHPLQTDGYNCGVFTCCLIDMLAKHQAINTNSFGDNTQTYMDDYRKNIRS